VDRLNESALLRTLQRGAAGKGSSSGGRGWPARWAPRWLPKGRWTITH